MVLGASVYDAPLLPYERELIKAIGVTEAEYKKFTAEVRRRGTIRPAEYAHIPDVRNDAVVTPILVSLAVGLILTGVAYLLTPKPKMPSIQEQRRGGGSVNLGDINGSSRFTPSRGFETLAELADYGSPIPLIFGRYDSSQKIGGMLVTPKLVWSRMFSQGTLQRAALLYVVGEQGLGLGIDPPELGGIFLGNNALDAIYEDFFAFYWAKNSKNTPRIRTEDILYGTRGTADSGDPGAGSNAATAEVFVGPTTASTQDAKAFCQAYSPSNNTQFGVYDAIANGTAYRLNYEIVNIFVESSKGEAKRGQALARLKIIGDKNYARDNNISIGNSEHTEEIYDQKHRGKARNYSPRMGIYKVRKDGTNYTQTGTTLSRTVNPISKDDKVFFRISATSIDSKFYYRKGKGESTDDINSSIQELQKHADDSLTIGEQFDIGGCIFRVISRSRTKFDPAVGANQEIVLQCIDSSYAYSQRVGLVNNDKVIEPNDEYIGDSYPGLDEAKNNIGETFYPLMKVAIAHVRNNRPAVTTEIGIKSTVYQQLRGLCSFPSLPTPDEIQDYDDASINVRTGRNSTYITRTSIFQVFMRIAGDSDKAFQKLGDTFFAVRGRRPVPQYTFLRFTLETLGPTALEFKFVQLSAASLLRVPDSQDIHDISQAQSTGNTVVDPQSISANVGGGIGRVNVRFPGVTVKKGDLLQNKEFYREPREIVNVTEYVVPRTVERQENLPAVQSGYVITPNSTLTKLSGSPGNIGNVDKGKTGAFLWQIGADAGEYAVNHPLGTQVNIKTTEFINGDYKKWVVCQWQLEVIRMDADHFAVANQGGRRRAWSLIKVKVRGSGVNFSAGEQIHIKRGNQSTKAHGSLNNYPDSNPFKHSDAGTLRWSGNIWIVPSASLEPDIVGRAQGYRYKIFGNATGLPVGTSKTVTRVKTKESGTKRIQIELTSTVKTLSDTYPLDVAKGWSDPVVTVKNNINVHDTTTNWEKDETFDDKVDIDSSNPYQTVYTQVGVRYKITAVKTVSTETVVTVSGEEFAGETQVSDLSFYRDIVTKSNDSSPEHEITYVNEIQENEKRPTVDNLTLVGLSLKAGENYTALDQMRVWLADGIKVKRLGPTAAYGDSDNQGPSSLFTDLVFYLLTDQIAGAGGLLNQSLDNHPLVDKDELEATSQFLHNEKLYFNGSVTQRTNLRQFISDLAPYFLCNFVIKNGKFSLKPAFPVTGSNQIQTGPIPVEQYFTAGNILEDSFKLEYLSSEERRPFLAVVRYRQERPNELPEEKVITVTGVGSEYNQNGLTDLPQETFDLTQFCTSEEHAKKVAKYFLVLRRFVTHTVSFSTTVDGLSIGVGSFIKVSTESSPYNSANNGTINSTGELTTVRDLEDGTYDIDYYISGSGDDVATGTMRVSDGKVNDSNLFNAVFSIVSRAVSANIYVVEQLTFSQEGTVDIVASEHACDSSDRSRLVSEFRDDGNFTFS